MTDLKTRFADFHRANPQVFAELERLTAEAVEAGVPRLGIELLMNRLRWDALMRTRGDAFKINQNYASRYARLLVDTHPEWDGLFEFRKLRTAA